MLIPAKSHAPWPTLAFLMIAGIATSTMAHDAVLVVDKQIGAPAQFGVAQLEAALTAKGYACQRRDTREAAKGDLIVVAGLANAGGQAATLLDAEAIALPAKAEALVVHKLQLANQDALVLCGFDSRGLMYAALDVADRIAWNGQDDELLRNVRDISEEPDMVERGLSIYTMQRAYFEDRLYDEAYWRRYFSLMARSRLNSFVVIFGYENGGFMAPPYPYFFDVDQFPDVRLTGITPQEQLRNVAAFNRVIELAHQHGVEFVVGIWDHIYRGGVQGGGIPGAGKVPGQPQDGLVWGVTAENLAAYNQAAIAKFLDVFPDIDGIQFRMHGESGLTRTEIPRFWHKIFALIKQQRPALHVDIRAKELPDSVIDDGLEQGIQLRVATKYWMEQMGLPFHPTHVNPPNQHDRRHGYADLLRYPQRYQVHWRLWNGGTARVLLWGDPEYVRRFVESAHLYGGNSFEVNEPLATKMLARPHEEQPFQLLQPEYRYYDWEFERYWYFFQLFGRLGYNPAADKEIWEQPFRQRFGSAAAPHIINGLQLASQVLPRIVAASYRYRYFPTTRGWAEKMRIDDLPDYATAEGSDVQQFANFREEAQLILAGTATAKRRPSETSRWFASVAQAILKEVENAEATIGSHVSNEYRSTIVDLKILAQLAQYHAHRMRAAVSYNLHRDTQDLWSLDDAIDQERQAVGAWQEIVSASEGVYNDDLMMGIRHGGLAGHWQDELALLQQGLRTLELQREAFELDATQLKIIHVPIRTQLPGQPFKIRVTIASPTAPEDVTCLVTRDGKVSRYALKPAGKGRYFVTIPMPDEPTTIRYRIEATDAAGQRAGYPPEDAGHVVVLVSDDRQVPHVALDRVAAAQLGKAVRVTARVQDPAGIKSVRLRYRHVTQFEDYQTVEMQHDSASDTYAADIPGEFIVPEWDVMYFVEAVDQVGNGRMYPDLEHEMPYVIVPVSRN